jgi:hypothetical protein
VTDMRGGAFRSDDREILASNGSLHADMLGVIAAHELAPETTRTRLVDQLPR